MADTGQNGGLDRADRGGGPTGVAAAAPIDQPGPDAPGVDRRRLLIGGGLGLGLIVAVTAWPRRFAGNLTAVAGESIFGAWLKIGSDGHVTVAVPQTEHGQGVYTTLPQIVADELGADWRTIAVEPAPLNPLYANPLGVEALFEGAPGVEAGFGRLPDAWRDAHLVRSAAMITAGSSSIRRFEPDLRRAAAAARQLLCREAAARWRVAADDCTTAAGFVLHGGRKLRFADLAADAAHRTAPRRVVLRGADAGQEGGRDAAENDGQARQSAAPPADRRLTGQSLPRLDSPSKVDGSANFAGDVRLPDMVFAAIRQGPVGDTRLMSVDRDAAARVRGTISIVANDGWVAAIASNWWAANRALDALRPRFVTKSGVIDSGSIEAALDAGFDAPGERMAQAGDLAAVFRGARLVTASYRAGLASHAAVETMSATAHLANGRLELWLPTQAPGLARAAAAQAIGVAADRVVVHPMLVGGSFGANLEHQAACQAAQLTKALRRPVQLVWSRGEDLLHDRFRPPAVARMAARLGPGGAILGWLSRIAAPATGHQLAARLMAADPIERIALATEGVGDPYAIGGAIPPYRLPAFAVDHHPVEIGVPTGHWRSGAHSYTAFFNECFIDELAHVSGNEPLSFRIGMLGSDARLARCLSVAAALGGWEGGVAGSGQGIACHSFRDSRIAVLAEAHVGDNQQIKVDRIVAAVDCGRQINPDIVRQQIEGGLIFGMAAALGGSTGFTANLADVRRLSALGLPRLADTPDITVELVRSDAEPGGVGELGVPAVAPAIANALQAGSGFRIRSLPLRPGNA